MVLGYWDMAASLVTTGAIDADAFRAAHTEVFGTFSKIQPFLEVERRKYRFRLLDCGPSRFYQLFLTSGKNFKQKNFTVITGDGNFLPAPLQAESIMLSVAQRVDVIIDFAEYNVGDTVQLVNCLRQIQGQGPSGGVWPLDKGTPLIQFQVVPATGKDPSRVPDKFRPLPTIDMSLVRQERTWVFDYVGGLWTINGRIMAILAGIRPLQTAVPGRFRQDEASELAPAASFHLPGPANRRY